MRRLLVANRGEIALRVFRACRAEGIETVAVAAPDDRGALHAESADALVEIASYLDPAEHVRAARQAGADAVHPGYGFLSESAELAEAVLEAGLTWVGPPPSALRAGGDKLAAKETARAGGVPVLPSGTPEEIGFPLLVKAAAGGGGRGMRVVRAPEELDEAPSPALDAELRGRMSDAAVAFARAIGYESAGTAEFVLDGRGFWFLELNARIQVEHPVTELVTGVDIVREQLRIASGEALSSQVTDCYLRGHAVEVRLYAEDPRSFLPQAGRLERLRLPEGVRVDSGVREGDEIGTAYDPMIAKLIAAGDTREQAFDRLSQALRETEIGGVTTNLPFLRWLAGHPLVRAGRVTTAFLTENRPLSEWPAGAPAEVWSEPWRLNLPAPPPRPAPDLDAAAGAYGGSGGEQSEVVAPMPGTVIRVLVEPGAAVAARQPLVVLEAMKMETPLVSPYEATVRAVHVVEGDRVGGGAVLVELDE